ncbi:MAG: hypothetical protein IKZ95_05825 [Lachnospiraceae bacterium]|nr:hypothetical protein [Lachnospiraceae bacterium]
MKKTFTRKMRAAVIFTAVSVAMFAAVVVMSFSEREHTFEKGAGIAQLQKEAEGNALSTAASFAAAGSSLEEVSRVAVAVQLPKETKKAVDAAAEEQEKPTEADLSEEDPDEEDFEEEPDEDEEDYYDEEDYDEEEYDEDNDADEGSDRTWNTNYQYENYYSADELRYLGVIYEGDFRWTWYSQNVLPGGGLDIPGRHVDENGYVCDENDRICLASSDLEWGTVVTTPFGKEGCVYDCGCASGTLDVYVDF